MTVRQDLAGVVNNDLLFTFSLTYNSLPLNLTGYTVTVVVKPSQVSADAAGVTYSIGSGLTMISALAGRFTLAIPRASTATPGATWYRVDVSNGSGLYSALCGSLTLVAA